MNGASCEYKEQATVQYNAFAISMRDSSSEPNMAVEGMDAAYTVGCRGDLTFHYRRIVGVNHLQYVSKMVEELCKWHLPRLVHNTLSKKLTVVWIN